MRTRVILAGGRAASARRRGTAAAADAASDLRNDLRFMGGSRCGRSASLTRGILHVQPLFALTRLVVLLQQGGSKGVAEAGLVRSEVVAVFETGRHGGEKLIFRLAGSEAFRQWTIRRGQDERQSVGASAAMGYDGQ